MTTEVYSLYMLIVGIFKASIAGVYSMSIHAFSHNATPEDTSAKVNVYLRKAGVNETGICAAHVAAYVHGAASCGTLVELNAGDELYCKGQGVGTMWALPTPFVHFQAFLLYKA